MNEFLTFRKMITPAIIQALFWIGVLVCVVGGLITMFASSFLTGLIMLVVGPLFVRIYCELLILLFKIHEELAEIRKNTSPGPQGFPVITPAGQPQ